MVIRRKMNPKHPVHTGYQLTISEEIKTRLDLKDCMKNPIVAVLFRDNPDRMKQWYKSALTKQTPCFAQGMFKTDKYLVLRCTIGGNHHWITLLKNTDISPIELKKRVYRGDLGKEIPIEKFQIPCTPYIV